MITLWNTHCRRSATTNGAECFAGLAPASAAAVTDRGRNRASVSRAPTVRSSRQRTALSRSFCGSTEEEVLAIAEHEHIPEMAAAALAGEFLNRDFGRELSWLENACSSRGAVAGSNRRDRREPNVEVVVHRRHALGFLDQDHEGALLIP
jgi:hypothetical protein